MKRVFIIFTFSFVSLQVFAQEKDSIFANPETYPSFPGGIDSLLKFIIKNHKYPYNRIDIEGTIYVQFIVNEDGSLSDTKIIKGLCEPCDKNVLETFTKMPKWVPGKLYDKPVKVKMVYPIKFRPGD